MKFNPHCDCYTDNSYFLLNQKKQITFFHIHSWQKLGYFLERNPEIGQHFTAYIAQKYAQVFTRLVEDCFKGKAISLEKRLKVEGQEDLLIQIVLTPVLSAPSEPLVACTFIDSNRKTVQMDLLNEYSFLASHDLRAPIANILSLSNLLDFPEAEAADTSRVHELLKNINAQAEKLDDVIKMLNRMINRGDEKSGFPGEHFSANEKGHIMLVDDDPVTNKLHHMIISKHNKNRKVIQFDNPSLALAHLDTDVPDLILLDLNMPEIDGWTFLRLLEERGIDVDVVIISSSIDPTERSRAQTFKSVKDFLTKPLTYEKIRHLVDN